jgi:ParB family chromosome partitioning protein
MPQQYGLGRGLSSLIPQKKGTSLKKQQEISQQEKEVSSKESSYISEDVVFSSQKASPKKKGISSSQEENPKKTLSKNQRFEEVSLHLVHANSHQPRVTFDEERLQELAKSIKEHGIIQPLLVKKDEDGYELIAGERRLRAAKIAGIQKVPIVIRDVQTKEKFELAILENVQRHDLTPLEEARAYKRLMEEFHLTQEDVALRIGKSRSGVANAVRFLDLPLEIQRGLEEGKISSGHAKVILGIDNPEKQRALYNAIVEESLTVRQAENRLRKVGMGSVRIRKTQEDPQLKVRENELSEKLGTKVQIKKLGQGMKVAIDFYSTKELEEFLQKFTS